VGGLLVALPADDGMGLRPSGVIGSVVGAVTVPPVRQAIERPRSPRFAR